jgi:hypothetical protein
LDVWQPTDQGNADTTKKLVSISFYTYTLFVIFIYIKLNILQDRHTEELKKIHMPELEDPRSVPFNVDAAYPAGGGTLHGRYMNVSIVLH